MSFKILGVGVVSLALVLIVVPLILALGFGGPGGGGGSGQARDFTCDVKVEEVFFGDVIIHPETNCRVTELRNSCGLFGLGIFSSEGTASVYDSRGKIGSKTYDTGTLSDFDIVTIDGCTQDTTLTIRLTNTDGNLVDSEQVSLV